MGPPRKPLAERFWAMVDKRGPDECWPWLGYTNKAGYGSIVLGGRNGPKTGAHRASYMLNVGPIPEGRHIHHRCENPSCVNPAHLAPVTNTTNTMLGRIGRKTHCRQGHPLDGFTRRGRGRRPARYCRTCNRLRQKRVRA